MGRLCFGPTKARRPEVFVLHPKVKAALIAAVITAAVSVAAAVRDSYPDSAWVGIASALIPVIAGYLKSAGVDLPVDAPAPDGVDSPEKPA